MDKRRRATGKTVSRAEKKKLPRRDAGIVLADFETLLTHATENLKSNRPSIPKQQHLPQSLPISIKSSQAALLCLDNRFVFASWEIDRESYHKAIERFGPSSSLHLRFYDITTTTDLDACPSWDVAIFDLVGNWYLKLETSDQKLCLDVGVKNRTGQFASFTRSNIVTFEHAHKLQQFTADHELKREISPFKQLLGPYFFELYQRDQLRKIANTSLEAIFYEISALREHPKVSEKK